MSSKRIKKYTHSKYRCKQCLERVDRSMFKGMFSHKHLLNNELDPTLGRYDPRYGVECGYARYMLTEKDVYIEKRPPM